MGYYEDYEEEAPRSKAGMILSAIGATMAMFPMALFMVLINFSVGVGGDIGMLVGLFTLIGMMLWSVGMFVNIGPMKANGSAGMAILAAIFLIATQLGFIFIALIFNYEMMYFVHSPGLTLIIAVGLIGMNIVLAITTRRMGQFTKGLKMCSTTYWILSVLPLALILFIYLSYHSMFYDFCQVIVNLLSLLGLVLTILCVIGWWIGAGSGIVMPHKEAESGVNYGYSPVVAQSETQQSVRQIVHNNSMPQQPQYSSAQPAQPAALPQELKDNILQMTNEQLQAVTDHPQMYVPAYVDFALSVLKKRQAWEQINEYDEAKLWSIVNDGSVSYETRDVASMELFSRNSNLLMDALRTQTHIQLMEIISNPENYFDGFVEGARSIIAAAQTPQQ